MLKITRDQLIAFDHCDLEGRLNPFGKRKSLTVKQALAAGVRVSDLLWVAGRLDMKRECVQFALLAAQRVAYLNSDPRVQAALDATQAWLDAPSDAAGDAAWAAARAAARAAGDAAGAAAWAAGAAARAAARDAARAAGDAAWAVGDAAWAAGAAARAAARDAAWAAGDAAWAAEEKAQREIFLQIFGAL